MSKRHVSKCTRKAIFAAWRGQISKTCIVKRDGEWVVQGKSCIISRFKDGTWDVWIFDPNFVDDGCRSRLVTNRVNRLRKYAVEGSLNEVGGEAWLTLSSVDFIAQDPALCRLLGIRRKKQLSAGQKMALLERLATHRRAKAA